MPLASSRPTIWHHCRHSDLGWAASPIRPDMIFGPEVEIVHHCTPSPFTVFGQKGAGESGYLGAPAASFSAVDDAVRPLGITIAKLPIRPAALSDAIAAVRHASNPCEQNDYRVISSAN